MNGTVLLKDQKRDHVASADVREHWSTTHYFKQTTAVGAGAIATTKHSDMFVDKETLRPRIHKFSSGNSKIGTIGKEGIINSCSSSVRW